MSMSTMTTADVGVVLVMYDFCAVFSDISTNALNKVLSHSYQYFRVLSGK